MIPIQVSLIESESQNTEKGEAFNLNNNNIIRRKIESMESYCGVRIELLLFPSFG